LRAKKSNLLIVSHSFIPLQFVSLKTAFLKERQTGILSGSLNVRISLRPASTFKYKEQTFKKQADAVLSTSTTPKRKKRTVPDGVLLLRLGEFNAGIFPPA
jgi:hypothetical protein